MLLALEASSDERGVSATIKGVRKLANAHNSAIRVISPSFCWQPCRTVLDKMIMTGGGLHSLGRSIRRSWAAVLACLMQVQYRGDLVVHTADTAAQSALYKSNEFT